MKFVDIENIWEVDLSLLSNADRGQVYFERAKQIVSDALVNPVERKRAVLRDSFRRKYLVEKIGSQPAVTTQNPRIKQLLIDVDLQIRQQAGGELKAAGKVPRARAEGRPTAIDH